MRCKRICRELLWLARFGEFGPSSVPHLDHLASCSGCRDEVGFDRALVQQLRVTLAERIANEEPSPRAWGVILERAQAPERGVGGFLRGHAGSLASRLSVPMAVTAMALAGIIATSTNVATHPEAGSVETELRQGAYAEPFERQPPAVRPLHTATPVAQLAVAGAPPPAAVAALAAERAAEETAIEPVVMIGAPLSRLMPADSVVSREDPAPAPPPVMRDDIPASEPY